MRHPTFDVLGFVLPLLVLLVSVAVVGAPVIGIPVPQVQLSAAALAATLSVFVLVRAASRGDKHE